MHTYETCFILKPNLTQSLKNEVISKIEDTINKLGKIIETKNLGVKQLAYKINGYTHGEYVAYRMEFEEEKGQVKELEAYFRTLEDIIKFIIVKEN